jgi:hypothetical protein
VTVATSQQLLERLRAFPTLDTTQAATVYAVARRKETWNPVRRRH